MNSLYMNDLVTFHNNLYKHNSYSRCIPFFQFTFFTTFAITQMIVEKSSQGILAQIGLHEKN